jgi:hypothetical protein
MRVQGPGGDQIGPRRRLHTHTASTRVGVVAIIQGGQGRKQMHLLACS